MTKQTRTESDPRDGVDHRWAVILAGGDGKRLLPLTRRLSGDDRPKQFCRVLGDETLLDQTRRRVERIVSSHRTYCVVTRAHESFYRDHEKSGRRGAGFFVQPCNRGTGPAIVYSLMRIHAVDPQAVVGFFPSDHHFADDDAFSDCVRQAFGSAESHSDVVTLLGIVASRPETSYGWIEPGEPLSADGSGLVFGVRRFWEKPSREAAIELVRRGCFWNSFIMVGRVTSFLSLVGRATPYLFRSFQALAPAFSTSDEEARVLDLYRSISSSSFCTDVLSACPDNLAVLCSKTLEWTDLGDVRRALSVMRCDGVDLPPRMERPRERKPSRLAVATE